MTPPVALLLTQLVGPFLPSPPPEGFARRIEVQARELVSDDARSRERAETELLALGPTATEPLLLMTKGAPPAQLQALRSILPKYGPAAVESLYWAVGRARLDPAIEGEAARAVARMGAAARPQLDRFLDSGSGSLPADMIDTLSLPQAFAIRVLREMGPAATPHLLRLLEHPDASVRSSAATLLGSLADPHTADALLAALKSKNPNVRRGAAHGLGSLGDRRAVDPLLELLADPNWATREAAVVALGAMYDRRLLVPLVRIARGDEQVMVRSTAAQVLIATASDPVAVRLGRRYKPASIEPMAEEALRLAVVIRLLLTGSAIYLLLWAGLKWSQPGGMLGLPSAVWGSLAGIALLGFVWARVLWGVSASIEWLLLAATVPATMWVAWMAGPTLKALRVPAWGLGAVLLLVVVAPLTGILWWLYLMWLAPRLLWLFLCAAIIAAWWLGRRADPSVRGPVRRATLAGTVAFYVGYGIGWWTLWGCPGA